MLDEFGDSQFASVKKHYQDLFEHYRRLRKRVLTKQKNRARTQSTYRNAGISNCRD